MKAITLHGPGDVRVESVPDPRIVDPTDAVLRITTERRPRNKGHAQALTLAHGLLL
jgi:hypothetical protein